MAQRALRLLIIVMTVGVLLMHGADASAAATHEAVPAVPHEHHEDDGDDSGPAVHWHHVAVVCIAVLTAAAVIARHGRRSTVDVTASAAERSGSGWWGATRIAWPGTGAPRWLDLTVIRR